MRYSSGTIFMAAMFLVWLLGAVPGALADDAYITTDFEDFTPQDFEHEDAEPFKGFINLTVTNTGTQAWGDFHFEIYEVTGFGSVENVDFITGIVGETDYHPLKDGNPVDFVVDNVVVGATLDLYFYDDPVLPTETVTFKVFTDNTTDQVGFFGVKLHPTPVPEPATLAIAGLGALALLLRKRKK
jgi:hypothetical protein